MGRAFDRTRRRQGCVEKLRAKQGESIVLVDNRRSGPASSRLLDFGTFDEETTKLLWSELRTICFTDKPEAAWFTSGGCQCHYTFGQKGREKTFDFQPMEDNRFMMFLRDLVVARTGEDPQRLNSAYVRKYLNGKEGVRWHSDDEKWYAKGNQNIYSFTLGAERTFEVRESETKDIVWSGPLGEGRLVAMMGNFQNDYMHQVPTEPASGERYNITFRHIVYHTCHLRLARRVSTPSAPLPVSADFPTLDSVVTRDGGARRCALSNKMKCNKKKSLKVLSKDGVGVTDAALLLHAEEAPSQICLTDAAASHAIERLVDANASVADANAKLSTTISLETRIANRMAPPAPAEDESFAHRRDGSWFDDVEFLGLGSECEADVPQLRQQPRKRGGHSHDARRKLRFLRRIFRIWHQAPFLTLVAMERRQINKKLLHLRHIFRNWHRIYVHELLEAAGWLQERPTTVQS